MPRNVEYPFMLEWCGTRTAAAQQERILRDNAKKCIDEALSQTSNSAVSASASWDNDKAGEKESNI